LRPAAARKGRARGGWPVHAPAIFFRPDTAVYCPADRDEKNPAARNKGGDGGATATVNTGVENEDLILQARDLGKDFRGFTAVQGVNLNIRRGSIHALIGPNGAGKTTCFNLLTRFLPATRGTILFKGRDITRTAPQDVARRGMIRSFQISSVFAQMTALQNVRVALQRATGLTYQFWRSGRVLQRLDERALELLGQVGLGADANRRTVELPYGRKRALEIATTLATEPELMLLDEPTQGMGHEDVGQITELIRRVAAGRTVLMVEHNMSVVSGLCDRITVLARGSVLAEGNYAEIAADASVREAYMGGSEDELSGGGH
jgi:branched-chain amino acid transport system ATP-binding protein